MPKMLAAMEVRQVILHEVPKAKRAEADRDDLVLSEAATPLLPTTGPYICERLTKSLSGWARPVVEDQDHAGRVPDLIRGYLDNSSRDVVKVSQELARELRAAQTGIAPPGLLMFA